MQNLIETTFKRLEKHFENNDCAFISACRGDRTAEENNIKTEELKEKLRRMGYGYVAIRGGYIENKGLPDERTVEDEKSFAVFNNIILFKIACHNVHKAQGFKKIKIY